jgi:acyl-CoA synthetase (AMP-forming)/AMP-acid ligase II
MSFDFRAAGLLPPSRRPEIPGGGPQNVAEVLRPGLERHPDAEALVGRHGRFSYAQLDAEANRAAHALRELGVEAGDRIACCLPNDVHLPIAFLASQRLGAIWVGINRVLAPPEKAYLLQDSGAKLYLTLAEVSGELAGHRSELSELEHVVEIAPGSDACEWTQRCSAVSAAPIDVEIDPFGPAAISYTSGTTGLPKGAVHSQHNLLLPGAIAWIEQRFPQDTRQGSVLSLTILNLVVLELLVPWYAGRCTVCVDRVDPVSLATTIREERIGTFSCVPTLFLDLLKHPDVRDDDLASLLAPGVGGAEAPRELMELYQKRFGSRLRAGYGMTEAPTSVTVGEYDPAEPPGYCGTALPQVCIEVVDEADRVLGPGEFGEITIRAATSGPYAGAYTPMLGYWNKPDATRDALRGGRYHTGDLGIVDERGVVFIRGRRNELILRGGANVYPAEVERIIRQHPSVASVAVLGIPDARLGERVVAAIERTDASAPLDEEELREYCSSYLARYKVPSRFVALDALPRNAMGKVIKRELQGLFS